MSAEVSKEGIIWWKVSWRSVQGPPELVTDAKLYMHKGIYRSSRDQVVGAEK